MTDLEEVGLKEKQRVLRVPSKVVEYEDNEFNNRFQMKTSFWLISQSKTKDYNAIVDLYSRVTDKFLYGIDYNFDEETTLFIESEMPFADEIILEYGEFAESLFSIVFRTSCMMSGLDYQV
ncbi:hypothetical protein [[Clostridium] fimetarium]|uniref:Uncharacterized protein n=1 Tax=[Clostridium] fimetarium TaxID=99656 RepID=A0A1I0RD34_9FIRM|nr:hypothetical protein [[Clostridium] fimetarium]SEW38771.1 hypothetical protein SAMN05421659_11437 [[Clostridium] fimetarium]